MRDSCVTYWIHNVVTVSSINRGYPVVCTYSSSMVTWHQSRIFGCNTTSFVPLLLSDSVIVEFYSMKDEILILRSLVFWESFFLQTPQFLWVLYFQMSVSNRGCCFLTICIFRISSCFSFCPWGIWCYLTVFIRLYYSISLYCTFLDDLYKMVIPWFQIYLLYVLRMTEVGFWTQFGTSPP